LIVVLIIEELVAGRKVGNSLPFCNCHTLLVDDVVVVDENMEEILKLKKFKKCALARFLSGISLAQAIPVSSAARDGPSRWRVIHYRHSHDLLNLYTS
jgi:hypothetical protein